MSRQLVGWTLHPRVSAVLHDREPTGSTAAESPKTLIACQYSAYGPTLGTAQVVGGKVVRYLVEHWAECETAIPR